MSCFSVDCCHTRLNLGFSAKLRIWQVLTFKMEPQSCIIVLTEPPEKASGQEEVMKKKSLEKKKKKHRNSPTTSSSSSSRESSNSTQIQNQPLNAFLFYLPIQVLVFQEFEQSTYEGRCESTVSGTHLNCD